MSLHETLTAFLEEKLTVGAYAGAAALVDVAGTVIADLSLGRLGSELTDPLPSSALFSLESISKVVCTAPLILSLSERGILHLDQRVATWLPEFRNSAKEAITPRHLLSHASGLPDTDEIPLDTNARPDKIWAQVLCASLLFPPGEKVHYSDLGFLVLGRAIEAAARKSLDQLARDHLWAPLGMDDTQFNPPAALAKRLTSNRGIHGRCVDALDRALGGIVGCDGVFSTAYDLRRFGRMMLGAEPRVLSSHSLRVLVENQTPFALDDERVGSDFEYLYSAKKALGWELPGTAFSHGGTALSSRAFGKVGGTGTFFWIDPARDLVAVYLTNHGQPTPFSEQGWEELICRTAPREFFRLVAHNVPISPSV